MQNSYLKDREEISLKKRFNFFGSLSGLVLLLFTVLVSSVGHTDYSKNESTLQFIDEMAAEEGFDKVELASLFSQVEKKQSIIDAMNRPAEKVLTWAEYRKIFLRQSRIKGGVSFWRKNADVLAAAEAKYGVPAEIIVSIIGVETQYGGNTGSFRVMDALSTLAFDYPRRSPFFTSELKHFLILAREQDQAPLELKGSYAGAMGLGQFMPSSYRAYAADYDEDGFIDIWSNEADAIWSVANYLARHGWKKGELITLTATASKGYDESVVNQNLKPELSIADIEAAGIAVKPDLSGDEMATAMRLEGTRGTEYWVGLHNFYVITRYNHSKLYAMAVFQLAEEIRKLKQG